MLIFRELEIHDRSCQVALCFACTCFVAATDTGQGQWFGEGLVSQSVADMSELQQHNLTDQSLRHLWCVCVHRRGNALSPGSCLGKASVQINSMVGRMSQCQSALLFQTAKVWEL